MHEQDQRNDESEKGAGIGQPQVSREETEVKPGTGETPPVEPKISSLGAMTGGVSSGLINKHPENTEEESNEHPKREESVEHAAMNQGEDELAGSSGSASPETRSEMTGRKGGGSENEPTGWTGEGTPVSGIGNAPSGGSAGNENTSGSSKNIGLKGGSQKSDESIPLDENLSDISVGPAKSEPDRS